MINLFLLLHYFLTFNKQVIENIHFFFREESLFFFIHKNIVIFFLDNFFLVVFHFNFDFLHRCFMVFKMLNYSITK